MMRVCPRRFGLAGLALLLAALIGCMDGEPSRPAEATRQPAATTELHVTPVDSAGFDQAIQALKGKVVVVDFWQTTCESCIYEFPRLVQLHDKLADKGLATVSMNLDDPASKNVEQKVERFLQQKRANFTNLRLAPGQVPDDWIKNRLKLTEGLPGQRVYDRHGKLVQTFTGGNDYEDIEALVDKLLKDKA